MSFIKQAISDAVESEVAPEGSYDLRIHSAEEYTKQGSDTVGSVKCTIVIESGDGNYQPVIHFVPLVTGNEDEESKVNNKLVMQKRFLELFSIPHEDDGFDPEDFVGCTASGVTLTQETQTHDKDNNALATPYTSNRIRLPRSTTEKKEDKGSKNTKGKVQKKR